MNRTFRLVALISALLFLQACAQYDNKRGVDVNWQPSNLSGLEVGTSTRKDVLALLGPPSQVISMDGESALYYLFAQSEGEGLILVVYNRMRINTTYDRAIFFFDDDDVLTEYASHINTDAT